MYTYEQLRVENEVYAGTGGVSQNNHGSRFLPAFRDSESGRVEIARMESGEPAAMHILAGLPPEWVKGRDGKGHIIAIQDSVEAGFVRDGVFYTRDQAAVLT